jgi:sugar phosphate isomerase/epimerase
MAITPAALTGVPFLFAGRIEEGIRCAADLGYDAVELHLRDPMAPEVPGILKAVRAAGLAVSSLGTGQGFTVDKLSVSAAEKDAAQQAVARIESHVRVAAGLGAVVIVGSMQGRLSADPAARAAQIETAVSGLRRVGDEAARAGVRVALEPLNRYETNFLNTVVQANAFLDRVGHPALGMLVDTFHANIEETSMTSAIAAAGRRLALVHLSDSNRGAPGTGHTNFRPLLGAMLSAGYDGYLSAEILPLGDDRAAAGTAATEMRRLIKEC